MDYVELFAMSQCGIFQDVLRAEAWTRQRNLSLSSAGDRKESPSRKSFVAAIFFSYPEANPIQTRRFYE